MAFLPALRGRLTTGSLTAGEGKSFLSHIAPAASGVWRSWHGSDRAAGWDMDAVIAEGYERSVWVFRSVELIAGSQSRLPFRIGRHLGGDDEEVLEDHPLYRVLNKQANPLETGRAFRKRLSAQVLLSKKGAFIEVTRSRLGTITRLDLLDPSRVNIMVSDSGDYIDYFEYTRPDGRLVEIPPERVRWVREPHPTDPFSGITPLEAAGISVELDQLARQYNVSFIKNDSRPGGVLAVDTDTMTEQEMARLEGRFKPGAHHAGELSVVASGPGGIKYVDTTTRPRDMAYQETSERSKNEILSAFGIGESLLGNTSGRTFDNAEQEEYNFWTKPMPPHLELIAGAFAGDVDDEYEPYFDTSNVDALEVAARRRREEARQEFDKGLRSVDEYRPLAGLDPLDNAQARAIWLSPNKAPVPANPEDAAELMGGEEGGAPTGGGDGGSGAGGATPPEAPETAAEVVALAQEMNTDDAEREVPEGPAAQVVAEARGLSKDVPAAGDAADAVAAAREPVPMPWLANNDPEPARAPEEAVYAADVVAMAREGKALTLGQDGYAPDPALTEAAEQAISAALLTVIGRQQGVITARINSPKQRRGTKFWTPVNEFDTRAGDAPMDMAVVVNADRWADEAAQTVAPAVQTAAVDAAAAMIGALVAAGVLQAGTDTAQLAASLVRGVSARILVTISEAVADKLGDLAVALDVTQKQVTTTDELVANLDGFYADRTPRFVHDLAGDMAHAVTTGATDAVATALAETYEDAIDDGTVTIVREWVSRRDTRVRPTHAAVDGTVLPAGEPFQVGADLMLYPQEPTASPQERFGCRCRLVYRISSDNPLAL